MTLKFIGNLSTNQGISYIPNYLALSSDIVDSIIANCSIIGAKVFLTDTQSWKIVTGDFTLIDFSYSNGTPPPTPPVYVSSEIGSVNGSTVVVTWNKAVDTAPDVTIQEDGVTTETISSEIQIDPTIVYYTIAIPWHGSDSTITVDGNTTTNNIGWLSQLCLQADTRPLGLLSNFVDDTIYHHDFTSSGDARPDVQLVGGYKAVVADGIDDWMQGSNFADNLPSFTIMHISAIDQSFTNSFFVIGKVGVLASNYDDKGWEDDYGQLSLFQKGDPPDKVDFGGSNSDASVDLTDIIITDEIINFGDVHIYINGSDVNETTGGDGVVTNISNSYPVTLFIQSDAGGGGLYFFKGRTRCQMIFVPAPPTADRIALEQKATERYGVSYP